MSSPWLPPSTLPYSSEALDSAQSESWGWAEVFFAMQLLWGLILFVPGAQGYRTIVRAMPYLVSGGALAYYFRQASGERLHDSTKWLVLSLALLLLNLLHETSHWAAGLAQIVFQICILAPAFWMGRAVRSDAQLARVVWIIFGASVVASVLGILQVYFPNQFLPPEFSALARSLNPEFVHALSYTGADGRQIIRPPGLSDMPGGAAVAAMITTILGLTLAFREGQSFIIRSACSAAAVIGMTALYFTHVRSLTLVAALSVVLFTSLRIRQGRALQATLSVTLGAVLVAGAYVWAVAVGGEAITNRFSGLADEGVFRLFQDQRGLFLRYTLSEMLYEFPLGAGLGRWGMMQVYFGDSTMWQAPAIYVEIQPTGWLLDGGVPLLLLYGGALFAALRFSYRLAARGMGVMRDIATITFCLQVAIICLCLTGPVFNTQVGILFWAMTGALYGATIGPAVRDAENEEFYA